METMEFLGTRVFRSVRNSLFCAQWNMTPVLILAIILMIFGIAPVRTTGLAGRKIWGVGVRTSNFVFRNHR